VVVVGAETEPLLTSLPVAVVGITSLLSQYLLWVQLQLLLLALLVLVEQVVLVLALTAVTLALR
jgi:hypothetical protein